MSSEIKVCPDCLYENDADAKFCNNCGYIFQEQFEFNVNIFFNIDDLIDDAILVYKGENYKRSLELIDNYLKDYPEDEYAWVFKSHILAKLEYVNDAISCCNIALNIDEMCQIAWISKALHYNLLENYDAALSCCQVALILDSQDQFVNNLINSISSNNNSEVV